MGKRALIVVDVQNDFITGSLPVPNAKEIFPFICRAAHLCDFVVMTKDYHPEDHKSFASNNKTAKAFEMGNINGKATMMWPDHCVQKTEGAEFASEIKKEMKRHRAFVFKKGMNKYCEQYSGFCDINGNESQLDKFLQKAGVSEVYVCGLATDYCVRHTALDAVRRGYKTFFLEDASRGITEETVAETKAEMWNAGITITDVPTLRLSWLRGSEELGFRDPSEILSTLN